MKKQPMELEKIFTYYISDKDYYPKYARNSHNSVAKIKQYNFQTMGRETDKYFFKEYIQLDNRYMKMCSTLLIIRTYKSKPQ